MGKMYKSQTIKRKRKSETPDPQPGAGRRVIVPPKTLQNQNQRGNAGNIETIEIDISDEESDSFNKDRSKKSKMEEKPKPKKGTGASTKGVTIKGPSSSTSSSKSSGSGVFLSAKSNQSTSNGSEKFSTAPEGSGSFPPAFKIPNPVIKKVDASMPPPTMPGPSSSHGVRPSGNANASATIATGGGPKKKTQSPTEKELKATEESRKIRIAIVEATQDELEKATKGEFDEINIDDLVANLKACIKMWPNINITHRYPQVRESYDKSHDWEIVEFGRWWLFGLTGLFFASPAMKNPIVREDFKMLIRTLCQSFCNGHPTLVDVFVPQLLSILRDLTLVGGDMSTMKIDLPFTKIGENGTKTRSNSSFEVKITKSNDWVIPHYLEAISIIFPRIFFYNHQLRLVLLELLNRLSKRLSPTSYGLVVMSTLHNALMPSMGYLTEKATAEIVYEVMKAACCPEASWRELVNHREIGSLAALSGCGGTSVFAVESSDLLCSPDFAMLYNNDTNRPLRKSFEFLFNEVFRRNTHTQLSSDMITVSSMMSGRPKTLNVTLHPLVENVIVEELLTVSRLPPIKQVHGPPTATSSLPVKALDVSELWSKIVRCWEGALNYQFSRIHPQPGQVNDLANLVMFLQNTATLMKLTRNLTRTLSGKGNGKYSFFKMIHLQRWTDVASFALLNLTRLTAIEKHQAYTSILDTIVYLDSFSWLKLSTHLLNTFIIFAGWPWLFEFQADIPSRLNPFPPFARNPDSLQFIKNSDLLMAKAIRALRLEIFQPFSNFVLEVYSSVMKAASSLYSPPLLAELLSAISSVSWPLKKMPLDNTFAFLIQVLQTDGWKVESCVRSGLGDAIAALPCVCCHSVQPSTISLPLLLESGCRSCSTGKYQEDGPLLELKQQYAEKIISLASPILQSTFLSVKLRLIELISRCNNHMENPSPVVAMSFVTVAVKGKAILGEKIFGKFGNILAESKNSHLETGCPLRLEAAQRIFRVALPKACRKLQQEKSKPNLSASTRMKIMLGIQELSTVGSISLSVFVEVMYFMLYILSQSDNDVAVVLMGQTIVANFAEKYKCLPHELITRIRSEICPKLVKTAIKQFYRSTEADRMEKCSGYIEMLKSIGSFNSRNTFAQYIYPTLMEHIVPKLHADDSYRFLLSALSEHANVSITVMLQETIIVWYPTLLLDHSSEMVKCFDFLAQTYKFEAMFAAKEQERRILNETLCRLHGRKEKILRCLTHLCKWDESSSQQVLSQGGTKSISRSEIQELLDKRMLEFFLHLDTKIKSRIETVQTKKRIWKSFVKLINMMGKNKMTSIRSKAYQTLNSVMEQGPVFADVTYEAWKVFAANLDNESFTSMTCPILAAILHLREVPSMRPAVDALISHFVCFKKDLTSSQYPKLYFLLDQCDDQEVLKVINAAVSSLKEQKWSDYFNMLVEEAGHSYSHIRYQAFRKLNNVFDKEAAYVEKFVLAMGEENVCRVISTLLAGLRGATGGKPGEEKMRLAIANCFGNLGAIDPFRFRNLDQDNYYNPSRRGVGLVLSAESQFMPFCLFYVRELIREFRDANDTTIFDYCVCLIRNLFHECKIRTTIHDPLWGGLSKEDQETISPMLLTKYVLDVEENLPNFSCPIYLTEHGKSYDEWLLNWLTVLITCISRDEKYAFVLFVKNIKLLRKNARIAAFLIPFVALHAIFCATNDQLDHIISEMKNILERWTILENRKVQNSMALRDSESEVDIFEEPMSVENESVFHFRCTQVIFSILDHLLRSVTLAKRRALTVRNKAANGRHVTPTQSQKLDLPETMSDANIAKVEIVLSQIPQLLISQVAFDSQSNVTALFYIEQELKKDPSNENLQKHLDYLQRIYVSLDDMDSVIGISAVRNNEPLSHERVLENIAEEKVEDYMKNIEQMAEQNHSNLTVNYALVQAYLSVDEPIKARSSIGMILAERPEWEVAFQDVQMESLVKLKSWDNLKKEVEHIESFSGNPVMIEKSLHWNTAVSRTISKLQCNQFDKAEEIVCTLRERLVAPLVAASEEMHPYKRAYDHFVQLHILSEIEDVIDITRKHSIHLKSSGSKRMNPNELCSDMMAMIATWDSRLMNVSKSRKTLDQILNIRKSIFEILKATFRPTDQLSELLNSSIRECWLDIAKDSSKCGNFIRADKALLEAKKFMSPKVFIEEAKILARKGNKENAVSVLQKGITQYFPYKDSWKLQNQRSGDSQVIESRKVCSKALLLLAKFCEEQKLLDKQDYIEKYKEAVDVCKDSEKNYFTLGSYFDRLWSTEKNNCDLQGKVCEYYSRSLLYGCKYVHQSLPRLLSIWFDHAASVNSGDANKSTANGRTVGMKGVNGGSPLSPMLISPEDALKNMEQSIMRLINNVPSYVLMTAFTQLISRLCHSHSSTWKILKTIIVLILKIHPHQTLWMTMAVHNSVNSTRVKRCKEIYKSVEKERPALKNTIKDYCTLSDQLLQLCTKIVPQNSLKVSLNKLYDKLPKFISHMGNVLMPFQILMNPLLPQQGFSHKEHDPYPETPVYISSIDDEIVLMTSLQRPKKLTLIASNGKRYGVLCKPKDDLRKDSKVMEVNSVVNWYLRQSADSSNRRLHVRTYSVVPINEECGLLEWVPNLQTMRTILGSLYKERGQSAVVGRAYIAKTDPLPEKRRKFQGLLDSLPPVFNEWFFYNFNDHQSWYVARTAYTRTAAVMSIVGYIMGLGDRHTENLLLDSTTGEVVQVDFNCLFNKGESFEIPERVPFRLTQNMVDAMGPLKYEGVFKRSCEITMNMFREHQNVFLSVFRPFVYDPLVEWQKKYSRVNTESLENGETTNGQAVNTMHFIQCRLNGTGRNSMREINSELSVEAQVKYLIDEATSLDNLCQMFCGWAAAM